MLLSDSRLITGLLKEALFSQKPISIEMAGQAYSAVLDHATDESPRVLETQKLFVLRLMDPGALKENAQVELRVDFNRFSVTFSGSEVRAVTGSHCEISCPLSALILNRRIAERIPFPEKSSVEVTVLWNGLHSKAIFSAIDHSDQFIGGYLKVPADLTLDDSTVVFGRIALGTSYVDLSAKLSTFVLIESGESESIYRIAIRNRLVEESGDKEDVSERRVHARKKISPAIDLVSPEQRDLIFEGKIKDCSLSGFTWISNQPNFHPPIVVGAVVQVVKPKIRVRYLGHRSEGALAFEIIRASVESRHAWMDILNESSGFNYKVRQGSEAERVLSLFIESGALATGYVNNNKVISGDIKSSLQKHAPYLAGLLHRWKLPGEQSEVDALASAFRVAESGWMIGDIAAKIASSPNSPRLSRREFVQEFIDSFSLFCETLTPCPEIFILFLEQHPFWQEFVSYVRADAADTVLISKVSYFRFEQRPRNIIQLEATKLLGKDWKHIKVLEERLRGLKISPSYFDARVETFSSPLLSALFDKFDFDFERVFFRVSGKVPGYLIVNKFSPALTLNQTVNCAWFIPDGLIDQDGIESVRAVAQSLSLKIGSSAPGLIVPTEVIRESSSSKSSILISGPPALFSAFFGRRRSAA